MSPYLINYFINHDSDMLMSSMSCGAGAEAIAINGTRLWQTPDQLRRPPPFMWKIRTVCTTLVIHAIGDPDAVPAFNGGAAFITI